MSSLDNNKIKVLLVTADLCDGGAQRVMATLATQLSKKELNVLLFVFCKSTSDYKVDENVQLIYLFESYEKYKQSNRIQTIMKLRKCIQNYKPDVTIGFMQGGYSLELASIGLKVHKIGSIRHVRQMHNFHGIRGYVNKKWFASADAVVLQCLAQKKIADSLGWNNTVVIGNPLNEAFINSEQHNYNRPCKEICMVGRLSKSKNYFLALNTLKMLAQEGIDVHLTIYGQGELKEQIENYIVDQQIEEYVTLAGWTNDVQVIHNNSDIFLLSSDSEGLPNALMEAMASGLICISTDCPTGPADLIQDGVNGFLIPLNDENKLQNTIKNVLLMTTTERETIGKAAKESMLNMYSPSVIADQWISLINNIIQGNKY